MSTRSPLTSSESPEALAIPDFSSSAPALSDQNVIRAVALLVQGLLTEQEFGALTSISPLDVSQLLVQPGTLAAVQRMSIEMRNTGALARLEAARHAREAVLTAAGIMRDPEMHASTRLNAATFIAKASGTERPEQDAKPQDRFTITINLGEKPIVINSDRRPSVTDQREP